MSNRVAVVVADAPVLAGHNSLAFQRGRYMAQDTRDLSTWRIPKRVVVGIDLQLKCVVLSLLTPVLYGVFI